MPTLTQALLMATQAPHLLVDTSSTCFRLWKAITLVLVTYFVFHSPYVCAFGSKTYRIDKAIDLVMCLLLLIDILMSFLTPSIDNNTNTYATTWRRKSRLFLMSWDAVRVIGSIPIALFPNSFIRYWHISRIVHIREILQLVSALKMEKYRRINRALRWARIIALTFFCIHLVGCIFYFIAIQNPDRSTAWFSVGDEELQKESDRSFFRYIMSIYWSTTVFTTVGYGDYHAINGTEMTFNVIFMLCYMVINSYLTSCISELIEDCRTANELKQNCEALRRFVNVHQLSDELQHQMYEYLGRCSSKTFSIQMFPNNIQLKVKQALSENVANSYLFNNVSATLLQLLVAEMDIQMFEAQDTILPANDFSKNLYILIHGGMSGIGLRNPILNVCGEFGVIGGLPQPYDVHTNDMSTLFCLRRKRFHEVMQTNRQDGPIIALNMLKKLEDEAEDPILYATLTQLNVKFDRCEINLHLSLKFACQRLYPRLLRYLIKANEDLEEVHENRKNVLHILVEEGKEGCQWCLKLLLQEMTLSTINQRDFFDYTPLCYAVANKNQIILKLFEERNIRLPDDKVAKFYADAVLDNDMNMLGIIQHLGGDINVPGSSTKRTALHWAASSNNVEMLKAVLDLGADKNLVDAYGRTPMEWASFLGNAEIVALLEAE